MDEWGKGRVGKKPSFDECKLARMNMWKHTCI